MLVYSCLCKTKGCPQKILLGALVGVQFFYGFGQSSEMQ